MAYYLKRGDLKPNLPFLILDVEGNPRDLTDVTDIKLVLRKQGTTEVLLKESADIFNQAVPANHGLGEYDWQPGDTDIEMGTAAKITMEYEWEITFSDTETQTVPANKNLTFDLFADIG